MNTDIDKMVEEFMQLYQNHDHIVIVKDAHLVNHGTALDAASMNDILEKAKKIGPLINRNWDGEK